ncbi:MAG: hypothetical protein JSR87_08770 [Proteobacteria bacterium]|nr:hypothetical protein [Pseudomonadota bacterium]
MARAVSLTDVVSPRPTASALVEAEAEAEAAPASNKPKRRGWWSLGR